MSIKELKIGDTYQCIRDVKERYDDMFFGVYIGGRSFKTGMDSHCGHIMRSIPSKEANFWKFKPLRYED